jgi:uncharacterized repeat protein (TIGR01451 family)
VTFHQQISNDGADTATNVIVTAVVPTGFTINVGSIASGGVYDLGTRTVTWTVPSMVSGFSSDLTYDGSVTTAMDVEMASTTATISADTYDPDASGNSDSINLNLLDADLSMSSTFPSSTPMGGPADFDVTVFNSGHDAAQNIVIDVFPGAPWLPYGSIATAGSYDSGTGDWTIPTLAPGAVAHLHITVVASAPGVSGIVQAEVTSSDTYDADSPPNNHNPAEDDQTFQPFQTQ